MKIKIFFYFLLLLAGKVSGQDISQLEYELSHYGSEEVYGDKIEVARDLHRKDPFNRRAIKYICDYYYDRKVDSVNIFFRRLTSNFPNNPLPYILWAEHINYDEEVKTYAQTKELKLQYLRDAVNIDPKNVEANFLLAKFFYEDFIFPLKTPQPIEPLDASVLSELEDWELQNLNPINDTIQRKSTYPDAAQKALKYFSALWNYSEELRPVVYFPIRQLQCYLNKNRPRFKLQKAGYFPHGHFITLKQEWECDFSLDYLFASESSKHNADYLEEQLKDLKEEPLLNISNVEVYRLTYLPSFLNPVVIRLERIKETYILTWKVGNGKGGYAPEGVKQQGEKKVKPEEWEKFITLINASDYAKLPNTTYKLILDGEQWILEHAYEERYLGKKTNSPSQAFTQAALYLFELAEVEVNTK